MEKSEEYTKSGDWGSWSESGELRFHGRMDKQIKIRGNRVELGEIEEVILQHPQVKQCHCVYRATKNTDPYITAYLLVNDTYEQEKLKSYIGAYLPDYMIPYGLVVVDQFPLTINGKLDVKALPEPVLAAETDIQPPVTEVEKSLFSLWQELLGIDTFGVNTSFFELGGHSLNGMQLLSRIYKQHQVKLELKDLFLSQTIQTLARLIETSEKVAYQEVSLVTEDHTYYPLSHAQKRLWILHQMEPSLKAYNINQAYLFTGNLNREAFEKAFQTLVERHESLRTVFVTVNGEPKQKIKPADEFGITFIDLTDTPNPVEQARKIAADEINRIFDLENGPLFLVKLVKMKEDSFGCIISMHHLTSDGWSVTILRRELMRLYDSYSKDMHNNPLEPLRIQYKDFCAWQNEQIRKDENNVHKDYWVNQFKDPSPKLNLPLDFKRPEIKTYNGRTLDFTLSKQLNTELKKIGRKLGASLYVSLLSALNILLYKLSNQHDIVIGSPSAGRNHQDLENQIGFYLNTLALRTKFSPDDSFTDVLSNVKNVVLSGFEHEIFPFDALVDELGEGRDVSRSALFDVFLILHNFEGTLIELDHQADHENEVADEFELDLNVGVESVGLANQTSMYDLTFAFQEEYGHLKLMIQYNTDLFRQESIEKMGKQFEKLLEAIVLAPELEVKKYQIITEEELREIARFNDTQKHPEFYYQYTFPQLFGEVAAKYPQAIALAHRNEQLSYLELDRQSNQFAHYLSNRKPLEGELVIIMLDRSIAFAKAVLSTWKCGAAYIPILPTEAEERVLTIVQESGAALIIADQNLVPKHLANRLEKVCDLIVWDEVMPEVGNCPEEPLEINLCAENLAYVIYTSGSTGKPKGAMVEHGGMLNHLHAKVQDLELDQHSVIVQNAPQVFDISVWQYFAAMITGGKTIVYDQPTVLNPEYFVQALHHDNISILELVPSYLNMLLQLESEGIDVDMPESLNYMVVTGEQLKPSLVRRWFEKFPDIKMVNAYGPTEASDDITHLILNAPPEDDRISIGSPLQNFSIYILDDHMNMCPIGVAGEIYVAGLGVGRGYLNDTALTEKAFTHDTVAGDAQTRMYKTGDLGRWLTDGNIEFLGRKDFQVKINGYRIELEEIENALLSIAGIKDAVVSVFTDDKETKLLCGYICLNKKEAFDKELINNQLKSMLPEYMIPAYYQVMEFLPLTVNGKIDRKKLPVPQLQITSSRDYVLPETDAERIIWQIWTSVLEKTSFGTTDNFFEVGGDSLKALKAFTLINKSFPDVIRITDFFVYSSVKSLAALIEGEQTQAQDNAKNDIAKVIL